MSLLIASTSLFTVSAKGANSSVTLSCVTFSWPDTIYRPLSGGTVVFNLTYKNNCTYDVLSAKYILIDKFGSSVASDAFIGLKAGVTANQSQSWMEFLLARGTEPFALRFSVEHYSSFGISNPAPVSVPFKFTERTAVLPSPIPTVTITATPAPAPTVYMANPADQSLTEMVKTLTNVVKSQTSQLSTLNAKLKKICAAKPKPKGC